MYVVMTSATVIKRFYVLFSIYVLVGGWWFADKDCWTLWDDTYDYVCLLFRFSVILEGKFIY
jgi:hypothetical protein